MVHTLLKKTFTGFLLFKEQSPNFQHNSPIYSLTTPSLIRHTLCTRTFSLMPNTQFLFIIFYLRSYCFPFLEYLFSLFLIRKCSLKVLQQASHCAAVIDLPQPQSGLFKVKKLCHIHYCIQGFSTMSGNQQISINGEVIVKIIPVILRATSENHSGWKSREWCHLLAGKPKCSQRREKVKVVCTPCYGYKLASQSSSEDQQLRLLTVQAQPKFTVGNISVPRFQHLATLLLKTAENQQVTLVLQLLHEGSSNRVRMKTSVATKTYKQAIESSHPLKRPSEHP